TVTLGGTATGTFTTKYNTDATTGSVTNSPKLTAAAYQTNLNTIGALNGNVAVVGAAGGPLTVIFTNALAGANVNPLTTTVAGSITAAVATVVNGVGSES